MKQLLIYLLSLILLFGCSSSKDLITSEDSNSPTVETESSTEEEIYTAEEEPMEERTLDELVVTAPRGYVLPKYNPSQDLFWDLKHMNLDVRFDWINEAVFGRAELLLSPTFFEQNTVVLDAKGFEIYDVTDQSGRSLPFEYDGALLTISLEKTFTRDKVLELTIDYVAYPSKGPKGGSSAITSDQGLFFINPRGEEKNKPQQIWTQGETEHNSRWFPTFDQPNERMTHDIFITVDERFVTLSNGSLESSKSHSNETRTDHWKMDQPHAPYLVMIAVGEFAVEREQEGDVLLEYYVEKEYGPYAKEIFAHTPEMIRFFADILDYPYPWNKYSQIITRDYVSGAMENTTAVIYGEFIQKTDRELIDNSNDYIVAHELFHHWFGDLVTTESWANLTLQEGFANYAEHLWQEYKYGNDAAGFQRRNERQGYLNSIMQSGIHPLIWYGYEDKEQMFDGHSYNKGGLVLHMLRHYLGDDAFFSSLNRYLVDNEYTAVEVDELRMAFEDVTGTDLNWFFNQWYHEAGHPNLELAYNYDSTGFITVTIDQTQDPEQSTPIFQLPVLLSVYNSAGEESQFEIFVDDRNEEFQLTYSEEPALIVFDRFDHLLFTKQESKTTEEYQNQYDWVDTYIHRFEAISRIKSKKQANETLIAALNDNHFSIRKIAVESVRIKGSEALIKKIQNLALNDPHSSVRSAALKKLKDLEEVNMSNMIKNIFQSEKSYSVIGTALEMLSFIDKDRALVEANNLKNEPTEQLVSSISGILADSGDSSNLPYFQDRLTSVSLFSVFNFYNSYYNLLTQLENAEIMTAAQDMYEIATDPTENIFYKYASTNTIYQLSNHLSIKNIEASQELKKMIVEIKAVETNPTLVSRYSSY